ncbi:MAG: alpha/beta hydrolase [Acidobacteriota bacterium]
MTSRYLRPSPPALLALGLFLLCTVLGGCGGTEASEQGVSVPGGRILAGPPEPVDTAQRYLFYLHGGIVEEQRVRPSHAQFGLYEYQKMLLRFADAGLWVISESRPPKTDVAAYAGQVAEEVRALLAAGVPADQITVVGFSKGGGIALLAANLLQEKDVRFVILGACGDWLERVPMEVTGQFLSIYELSDDYGRSCRGVFARGGPGLRFREIRLALGRSHGVFYRALDDWLLPTQEWALGGPSAP